MNMNVINMLTTDSAAPPKAGDQVRNSRRMMTWQAVQSEVLARIRSGQWPAGELIPTEMALASEFGCARATINRALSSLASSGLLERRRKVGTRVARHPPRQSTLPKAFLRDEIESTGAVYGVRVTSRTEAIPPLDVARALMMERGSGTIAIQVVHTADDEVYCCEDQWINPAAAPGLDSARFDDGAPGEWIAENVAVNHGTLAVSATSTATLPEFVGRTLGIGSAAPVLVIERTSWSDAVAVSLSRQYFRQGYVLSSLT